MSETLKFRYTFVFEIEVSSENYPDGEDPLEIEKEQAVNTLCFQLDDEDNNIDIKVEQLQ